MSRHDTAIDPRFASAMQRLRDGRPGDAEALLAAATAEHPQSADTWHMLGICRYRQGKYALAIEAIGRARELDPRQAAYHNNIGLVYRATGDIAAAIEAYRQALRCQPDDPDALNNLGNVLRQEGRLAEAISCLRKAVAARPGAAAFCFNLGAALSDADQYTEAEACYLQGLQIEPGNASAHNDLGKVYRLAGALGKARQCFEKAIELDPGFARAYSNLAGILKLHGDPVGAVAAYRKALDCDPHYASAFSNMLFAMQYSDRHDTRELFATHLEFARRFEQPLKSRWEPHGNDADPHRRLRVGYVSADFNQHAVAHFLLPTIERHDKAGFEIYCYYNGTRKDAFTERFQAAADAWIPCGTLDDDTLAARIRADRIDILVDMSGHTAGNRLLVFARKPAPLQVTWLGYFGTSGLEAMDFRLTDEDMDPPGKAEAIHSERLIRLPHFSPFQPVAGSPDVNGLPALESGKLTLASLNNLAKLSKRTIALWARILARLPDATLMLCNLGDEETRRIVLDMFAAEGVEPSRLDLQPWMPMLDYLALHHRIDLALDPFPYNGGTITNHSLWMGVPVVTLEGDRPVGRIGASIMRRAGLPQFVCGTEEEYLARVVELAADLPALSSIRAGLRTRLQEQGSASADSLTGALESALRNIWSEWCAGRATIAPSVVRTPAQQALERGHLLHAEGRLQEAAAQYRAAIESDESLAEAHGNLANVLFRLGDIGPAKAAYLRAVVLQPEYDSAWHNLGNLVRDHEGPTGAIECYRRALALRPAFPEALNNLGIALRRLGRQEEAAAAYREALGMRPDYADARLNLANVLKDQQRFADAEAILRAMIAADPGHALAWNSLGAVRQSLGNTPDAIHAYRKALTIRPDMIDTHVNLGSIHLGLGDYPAAVDSYTRALAIAPGHPRAWTNYLFASSLQVEDESGMQRYLGEARRYAAMLAQRATPFGDWSVPPVDGSGTLRVGFVSGDLNSHPVGYFLEGLLSHLGALGIELHAYPTREIDDELSRRIRHAFRAWTPLTGLSDRDAAELVRRDGIHVLIDLSGYTAHNKMGMFAWRPAPVQASWLGYWASTGLAQMDFIVADGHSLPPHERVHYTEEPVYLPHSRLCFTPPAWLDVPPVAALPARAAGTVTFGSFQGLTKISDAVLHAWSRILAAVPGARLRLQNGAMRNDHDRRLLVARLVAAGIAPDRVLLHPPTSRKDYLRAYAEVDVVLDTFPYTGGTTTCEALWMGVPTLTLAGCGMLARQGAAINACLGMHDWIAHSVDEYVAAAVRLVGDIPALEALRSGLREHARQSPLFDAPQFARDFDAVVRQMWRQRAGDAAGRSDSDG